MDRARFAPEFSLRIDGAADPRPSCARRSRACACTDGLRGARRSRAGAGQREAALARSPAVQARHGADARMGYAPDPLVQVFDGEVLARGASFPSGGAPTFTVTAHDRRHKMREGNKVRWFAIPMPVGNLPLPDIATASIVDARKPDAADLRSGRRGAVDHARRRRRVVAITDPDSAQKVIRKQANESDYDFLGRIAAENGWDVLVEHDGPVGGHHAALHVVARPSAAGSHARIRPLADRVFAAHLEGRADRQRSADSCGCPRSR